ncbi:hypothetical protein HAX54_020397 [Datura stramonium]|uniref:Uncharacterized protein n=1 Tax=Datura stramonium TaxID=4076 RepID=A0ABS8UR01_DATST|nr:hypothetical protein [Datura stramonium]
MNHPFHGGKSLPARQEDSKFQILSRHWGRRPSANHRSGPAKYRWIAGSGIVSSSHCLDSAFYRCFADRDQRLMDSHQWNVLCTCVLPSTNGSSAVCGSLPAAHRSSVAATSFFMMIPPLVCHLIFRVVIVCLFYH